MTRRGGLSLALLMGAAAACATRAAAVLPPAGAAAPIAVASAPAPAPPSSDFETQVRPLLESRCSPCHFTGGKMYDKLPFDRPATIRELGERLFTRIKDENDRSLIRAFLASPAGPAS